MFGDLGKMMKLAGEMKTKMPELKEKLANTTYTAEVGGGSVTATVNGRLELVDVKFSEVLWNGTNVQLKTVEELVTNAVRAAQKQAAEAASEAMKELTGGMYIPEMNDLF
jgi:hypothetical protein